MIGGINQNFRASHGKAFWLRLLSEGHEGDVRVSRDQEKCSSEAQNLNKSFIEILSTEAGVSMEEIQMAQTQKVPGEVNISRTLIRLGLLSETALQRAYSKFTGYDTWEPQSPQWRLKYESPCALRTSLKHRFLILESTIERAPTRLETLAIVMADPLDVVALDVARKQLPPGAGFVKLVGRLSDILQEINGLHMQAPLQKPRQIVSGKLKPDGGSVEDLASWVLSDGFAARASDIHFAPENGYVRVLYRIDGVLQSVSFLKPEQWQPLQSHLKLQARLNIAESRRPQSGQFQSCHTPSPVDIRLSTHPTLQGESMVLRLHNTLAKHRGIQELGLDKLQVQAMLDMIQRPSGLVIVTGPTGSGKTTTIYALLQELTRASLNVLTIEDPVEAPHPHFRQTSISPQSDTQRERFGYAEALKSALRQDPDVIFIGEIRDAESAQMAVRAARTGHRVFTTMHTASLRNVVERLIDFGLSPAQLRGTLTGFINQRLLRVLCNQCQQTKKGEPLANLDCKNCRGTGFHGRVPLQEALRIGPENEEQVFNGGNYPTLLESLEKQGLRLVKEGITSAEELTRICGHIPKGG